MNEQINRAILQLRKRAEKYSKEQLVQTFVDVGPLFTLLTNPDHQILYGRRGTGKTHVLSYLSSQKREEGQCSIYVDLRTIGSTGGLYSDTSITVEERATKLLVDVLSAIHDQLLDFAIENANKLDLSIIGPILDGLASSITEVRITGPVEHEETVELSTDEEKGASFEAGYNSLGISIKNSKSKNDRIQHRFHRR